MHRKVPVPPLHAEANERGPRDKVRSPRAIFLVSLEVVPTPELPALLCLLAQIPVPPARGRSLARKRKQENKVRNLREQFGMDSWHEPRTRNASESDVALRASLIC